jgi:hypothetical protein
LIQICNVARIPGGEAREFDTWEYTYPEGMMKKSPSKDYQAINNQIGRK